MADIQIFSLIIRLVLTVCVWLKQIASGQWRRKFPRAKEVTNRREALAPGPELHNWFWSGTSFIKASEEVDRRRNDGRVLRITETPSDYTWKI